MYSDAVCMACRALLSALPFHLHRSMSNVSAAPRSVSRSKLKEQSRTMQRVADGRTLEAPYSMDDGPGEWRHVQTPDDRLHMDDGRLP
jgi:hypothetical protein